jgi:hypothetical protein
MQTETTMPKQTQAVVFRPSKLSGFSLENETNHHVDLRLKVLSKGALVSRRVKKVNTIDAIIGMQKYKIELMRDKVQAQLDENTDLRQTMIALEEDRKRKNLEMLEDKKTKGIKQLKRQDDDCDCQWCGSTKAEPRYYGSSDVPKHVRCYLCPKVFCSRFCHENHIMQCVVDDD